MTSFDYANSAATALRVLTRFGRAVTVTRETPGAYDPATGTDAAGTTETWTPQGVKLEYSQREVDGTNIRAGDQRVYMSAIAGMDPQTGDTVTLGTEDWRVVISRPLAPAGVTVLHDCQVRRG